MDNLIQSIHSAKMGKNKHILSDKKGHTHKIIKLSTSYKQIVDNLNKQPGNCVHVLFMPKNKSFFISIYKNGKELLDFARYFKYNRTGVL